MDQDSTRNGSATGDKRNWRDRLGVSKGLPKLSDEFRPRDPITRTEARSGTRPGGDEGTESSGEDRDNEVDRQTTPRRPTPVERLAPMAPRMPTRSPAPPVSRQNAQPSRPQVAVIRPPKPLAPPSGNGRQVSAQSERPVAASKPRPQASNQPGGSSSSPPASRTQPASRSTSDEFGERLRAQREAAERLVQQRLAAARHKGGQHDHASGESGEVRPKPLTSEERPRFTFADEEIAAARRETPAASVAPIAPPPYTPSNSNFQRAAPRAASEPARGSDVYARGAPSPYGSAKPETLTSVRPASASAPELTLSPEREGGREGRVRRLEGERRTLRRGAHARELGYVEDDLDEAFEEERPARRAPRKRPKASDYSAAYRGYDDDYADEEPRRRSGPLILLLTLLTVAAIAGGLIYWYQQQQQQAATRAVETGDVPVVTAPQEPVKTQPEPQQPAQQQQALQQPQGRKQIYDRILGEETLEPERIVPTEEQPQQPQQQLLPQVQQPPAQEQQQTPPADQSQTLTPPANQQDAPPEPLPVPIPPPPGTGEQGGLQSPGQTQNRSTGLQVPEPAASTLQKSNATDEPANDRSANRGTSTDLTETSSLPAEEESLGEAIQTSPPTKAKRERAATQEPAKPRKQTAKSSASDRQRSLDGSGPVQIAPIPLAPQPTDQPATLGQQAQTPTVQPPAPVARERRIGRDKDPLEGFRTPPVSVPNSSNEQGSVGRIASTTQDAAQPVLQPAVQTTEAPSTDNELAAKQAQQQLASQIESDLQAPAQQPVQQVAVAAPQAPQQQQVAVAAPQQPAETASQSYVVQLASFRSEAEATGEFQRLSQRHPSLVGGMTSRVERSDLGAAGTFYRLGVGPIASKDAASKLCNSLIAAGEKDCLVRRQ